MKTCVVIDSTFYMLKEDFEKYKFKEIPLTVNFDDVTYREARDDGEQAEEVFKKIFNNKKLPTTSQPSGENIERVFKEAVDEGYTKIICLHISGQLSGTQQGVNNLAQIFMEENPGIEISVYDSKCAAQGSGLIAIEVAKIVQEDGDISHEEIIDIIDYYRKNLNTCFFIDTLDFLSYGGRIPSTLASIGNIFGIVPVLSLNDLGGIEKVRTERTIKKGIAKALNELNEENYLPTDEIYLVGVHIGNEAMTKKLLKEAKKNTNATIGYCAISNFGIVIGNHLGPKAFGFGWVKKYKRRSKYE